jgi:hypothetical protein
MIREAGSAISSAARENDQGAVLSSAFERLARSNVKYRFVIDMASLK